MNKINVYKSPQELAQKFGDYLVRTFSDGKIMNIALSGGSTPRILFEYMAETYPTSNIWQNIHFYWGDERCVPPDDEDSNFKMARNYLFDKIKIPAENIHRVLGENNPVLEAVRYSKEINDNLSLINGLPCFDLIILGMGHDGHVASIFPHQMELLHAQKICEVATHPDSGQKRITLTGKVLNNAKEIAFLVAGENKKEKIAEIINQFAGWELYPASFIKSAHGTVNWFLDKAAAKNL